MQSLINLIFTQIWEMKRMNMRADNVLLEIIPGYTTGTYIIISNITFRKSQLWAHLSEADLFSAFLFFICLLINSTNITQSLLYAQGML